MYYHTTLIKTGHHQEVRHGLDSLPFVFCSSQLVVFPLTPSALLLPVLNVMRKGDLGLGETVLKLKGQRFGTGHQF